METNIIIMGLDVFSYFKFYFSNIDKERKGPYFQREIEQKFLNLYCYSSYTLLTRFEMDIDKFTADIMGNVRPEEIASLFKVGQINMTIEYWSGGLTEERIKIVDGDIIEHVMEDINLDERFRDAENVEP